jgi:DNA-binding MarR family transcriptional regulator
MTKKSAYTPTGAGFLVAQLGAHAARVFGERIEPLGISPPHAGILRLIASKMVSNQRDLARTLGMQPSRLVILLDELSRDGFVTRARSATDRRNHELTLTKKGMQMFLKVRKAAAEHEQSLLAALSVDEQIALAAILRKVSDQQGLTTNVHPGYRKI